MLTLKSLETKNLSKRWLALQTACLLILFCCLSDASAEETYRFKRMWPTLQQPWYFTTVSGIAMDETRNVYIRGPIQQPHQEIYSGWAFHHRVGKLREW